MSNAGLSPLVLSVILVLSTHDDTGVPVQVVWPWTIIPLLAIVTGDVHVQLPEGITTVSPVAALLTAVWTSDEEQDAAFTLAAWAA